MPFRSFDDYIDEKYPPGSPERAEFDAAGDRLVRRHDRVQRLTGWMRFIPPRWEYTEPEVIEGVTYRFHHGVGHIAQCFWGDILDTLLEGNPAGYPLRDWLGHALYNACDGLAFHYLDDIYVPHLADVRDGSAGRRITSWRRRHAAAIVTAQERLAQARVEGFFDGDGGED